MQQGQRHRAGLSVSKSTNVGGAFLDKYVVVYITCRTLAPAKTIQKEILKRPIQSSEDRYMASHEKFRADAKLCAPARNVRRFRGLLQTRSGLDTVLFPPASPVLTVLTGSKSMT